MAGTWIVASRACRNLALQGNRFLAAPSLDAGGISREMLSTISLRRPPSGPSVRSPGFEPSTGMKWRAHAVPLMIGDYADPYDSLNDGKPKVQEMTAQDVEDALEARRYKEEQAKLKIDKERWLKNSEPPVRVPIIDAQGNSHGRGTRKTAHASVFIHPGLGHVVVNGKDIVDYFCRESDRDHLLAPLVATDTCGRFDLTIQTFGGGLRGQAGAIRLALARALNNYNPDKYRPPLKELGYLTRDPRMVERKKIGHLKARKKPQWARR